MKRLVLVLVLSSIISTAGFAQPLAVPTGASPTAASESSLEEFHFPPTIGRALAALKADSDNQVVVEQFPVAPFRRETVRFERVRIWSDDARIHWFQNGVESISAPPDLRYFRGQSLESGARLRVRLNNGLLDGLTRTEDAVLVIDQSNSDSNLQVIHELEIDDALHHSCGNELASTLADLNIVPNSPVAAQFSQLPVSDASPPFDPEAIDVRFFEELEARGAPGLRQAVVAVDTDSTFMAEIANPTAYIADLFSHMNLNFYEPDLGLELVVGDTFLRAGSDPFTNSDSPANSATLGEFRSYWNANMQAVQRVWAMLLSGNSSSSNSASGIAYVNQYCSGAAYSVTQIFYNFPASSSGRIVGHELGHNAGSSHTHCYATPVDTCYNAESGCYEGPVSCPSGGRGTIMSYCHFSGPSGANCGPNLSEFHPTVIDLLVSRLDANSPGCVEDVGEPGEIFADGFESGNTSAWN